MGFGKVCLFSGAAMVLAASMPACAQDQQRHTYDLPAQDLKHTLRAIARGAGLQLIGDSRALRGKQAKPLKGDYTVQQALGMVLKGSDMIFEVRNQTVFVRGRVEAPRAELERVADETIVITGSRIRGVLPAAPVLNFTQESILEQGFTNLGDAARSIPQNFGGSQNPGVGLNVPENSGTRLGAGSSINLRGLGGDATLTLLNGHRLTYNAFKQAIDVSAIPVAAIDRMEISADGSSAIYGSDAVAGVVNIILKKDFDGLNVAGRWGASTDGGNKQQQYGAVAGRKWASGGILLAYDFEHDTPILAGQRSYAANVAPGLTLYPEMERHNVVLAGHQEILAGLTLTVDGIYNRRYGNYSYALTSLGNPTVDGAYNHSTSTSFSIAPALTLVLPHDWEISLSGTVGQDKTRYGSTTYVAGNPAAFTLGCYCNKSQSVELSTDGPLVSVPAGKIKIAAGAGYRANAFHGYRTLGTPQNIKVTQDSYYAYGELNIPLVSPGQHVPLVNRVNLGLAARYEAYPNIDDVFTPKISVVFAPSSDVDFRGSWGKSFRTPTLYQRFTPSSVSLVNAGSRGGIGLPGTATVLTLTGGSTNLKPERATTWSATMAIHPEAVPGARLDISYFDVSYRDRIVAPVVVAQGLSNPIYADFVTRNPTAAEQAALIAGATNFVNGTGQAYDPGNVVAIISNANVNAAEQKAHGIDILAQYRLDLGGRNIIRFDLNGSVLTSRQTLSELQPSIPLAGRIFNPARFRSRGGVTWTHADLTVAAFANYTSGLDDARATTIIPVASMTTVDMAARYRVQSTGLLDGLVMSLSVLNLFNRHPSLLKTTQVYEAPYESTNFSPVGRFISFGLSKQW